MLEAPLTLRTILAALQRHSEQHPELLDKPLDVLLRPGRTHRSDRKLPITTVFCQSGPSLPASLQLWTPREER